MQTRAWLARGISNIPGTLSLGGGHVAFRAESTGSAWPWQLRKLERLCSCPGFAAAIEAGESSLLFRWPVGDVRYRQPWFYFQAGLKLYGNGRWLRFSFATPANLTENNIDTVPGTLRDLGQARAAGRRWALALATHQARRRRTAKP